MKIIITILLTVLVFIASCSQGYIVNMNEQTKHSKGRELFVSKCNACHQFYDSNQFTKAEWDSILVPMKKKAKINENEKDEILSWILEIKENRAKLRNNRIINQTKNDSIK